MKVETEHHFEQDRETVYAMFCDPDYYVAKFEALGDRNVQILESTDDDEGFSIEIEREVQLDAPGMLKSVLGEWNALRQTEHWREEDGDYVNELQIHSDLVPMTISGTMRLVEDGEGCINIIEMNLDSRVPLIGKALVKFAAENTAKSLDEEYDFALDYLGESE